MASALPVRLTEVLNLAQLGLNPATFSFTNVGLESEKVITVREDTQVATIEVKTRNVQRRPMKASAALMNPELNVLALRARVEEIDQLQVFNLDMKAKMKSHQMNEQVEYWKWVSVNTLALVTKTKVLHWSMDGDSEPRPIFQRLEQLAAVQIINYRVSPDNKWAVLTGIQRTPEGRIGGVMQLFSFEKQQSQVLPGHAASFGSANGNTVFCFANRDATAAKIHMIEFGAGGVPTAKRNADIAFPPELAADFPVGLQVGEKYQVAYVVTQQGLLYVFDIESAVCIYKSRISRDPIFLCAAQASNSGVLALNKSGVLYSVTIDEDNVVPFITNQLGNADLAFRFASRNNLSGAEGIFQRQFDQLFMQGMYKEAAKIAADSPGGFLRTMQTIERFRTAPQQPGQGPPFLLYFGVLLDQGKLNAMESVELCRYVISIDKAPLIEKWLQGDQLECSEELGDIVKQRSPQLALQIYLKANAPAKVIVCFAEMGQFNNIIAFAKRVGYKPDYIFFLNNILQINPPAGKEFAEKLLLDETGRLADATQVLNTFVQRSMVQEATGLFIEVLKGDNAEDAELQTRILEINLASFPQVADVIMTKDIFHHFDRQRVAQMCEKAGLAQRALELYKNVDDIKRVVLTLGHLLNIDLVAQQFSALSAEEVMGILDALLKQKQRPALNIAVQVAIRFWEQLTVEALVALFETNSSVEGLFFFLHSIVNDTESETIVFKYVQAAAETRHFEELKRLVRENNTFNPAQVKDYLMGAKLPDQIPLIIVCDRFDFVDELTHYLYNHNMVGKIQTYVQKVNPLRTPVVVGALLDSDCDDSTIKELIMSVGSMCPVTELVEQVERRNRLKILQGWLEARVAEGSQDPAAHNALAKIYVDMNQDPQHFLENNMFYDSLEVGKYCEKRDPHLAFVAYRRGQCDMELVSITNRSQMFKQQARYLVHRQSLELWAAVLNESNEFRRSVIDQVVSTALPECKSADEVSTAVRAFMNAELPNELIELLEKIVLEGSDFAANKNLQNLLILTAIKADRTRVMDYINRLDNYDGPEIAPVAVNSGLFEEAFVIYTKYQMQVDAVRVLLDNLQDLERAGEFAERANLPDVWSSLAGAQLNRNLVKEAIASYVKAGDPSEFQRVIDAAERTGDFEDLVKYLFMARNKVKKEAIDNELVYSFAKIDNLAGLEDFISGSHVANLQNVGDRCFAFMLFEAARVLFDNIQNYGRLASTLVKLERYQQAVEAARKANKTNCWKEVTAACVQAREFRLASQCAQQLIIQPDELDELVRFYEVRGYFEEITAVLEAGLSNDRAHTGLFTSLGLCYSKYRPEKLMEHLKLYVTRLSIPRLLRCCESNQQWHELTYLYKNYNEYDNAATVMMEHSPDAWEDMEFKDVIVKVSNTDIYYKAINFYLGEQPDKLNALLGVLTNKIDNIRVVQIMRKNGNLALIKPYLKSIQSLNIQQVNEALNELYVEEEDVEALQSSIDTFDAFDNIALARTCEKHELIRFRQVAAYLYKKNKRYQQSVELCKKDKMWQVAMETAAESKDTDVCEGLVRYFVDEKLHECFAAALYNCFDNLRPDVVLELAWRNGIINLGMPYVIQVLREYTSKIDNLIASMAKEKEERVKKEAAQVQEAADAQQMYVEMSGVPPAAAMYAPVSGYIDPQMMMMMQQQAAASGYPPQFS